MAKVSIFNLCVMLILSSVDSCYIPDVLYVPDVPHIIPVGYEITKVELTDCDSATIPLTSTDSSFTVLNGAIVAVTPVLVGAERTFYVWTQDGGGPGHEIKVYLVPTQERDYSSKGLLKRFKRRWSPPPFHLLENKGGPYPQEIDKIVSDSEIKHNVYYTISGRGVDQTPVGVFSLHRDTGMLSVHESVDREEYPVFMLRVSVFDRVTNQETDIPLNLQINIDDVNDNDPQFKERLLFSVPEQSSIGSIVGKVNATDRDKPDTQHVKIKYTLVSGFDLFTIHPVTGVITTKTNTLDREVKDKHTVTVKIQDMFGEAGARSTTGTATITLTDINDNPPTFVKPSHAATIKENEKDQLILRIPVQDKDLINTPNWISKFVITKGNENGNFRIDTDPKTNDGLLYVTKGLDYEKNKNVKLEVTAQNQAELTGTTAQWLSIPVDVAVTNVDEGPEFITPTVMFSIKENIPNDTVIGTYKALDPETQSSDGIKYYKVLEPASWINVDRNTGELRVANTIDRESHFVQDGVYNMTVRAVDGSAKTGTGTVIIKVEDVNDNVPELPTSELIMCEKEGELGSVLVVAEDKDQAPFSAPFAFALPSDHEGKWSVIRFNDTAGTLKHLKELPTGIHEVPLTVSDLQGASRTQTVKVRICHCRDGACLAKDSSVSLGSMGILALLLPLALLLLLCLLLAFFCMTKREKMELEDVGDSGGILLKSNTEAPGDEVDSSLINVPTLGADPTTKGSIKGLNSGWLGNKSTSSMGALENGMYKTGVSTSNMQEYYTSQYDSQFENQQLGGQFGGQLVGSGVNFDQRLFAQDAAFLHTWQTNGCYLHQKLDYLGTEEDGRYADDIVHAYGYEGVGSAAGSVGCCSDFGDNDNLEFLNTLGPKFKTLAEVCTKT